jgi:transposase
MSSSRRKEISRHLTGSELDERLAATSDGELLRRYVFVKNLYCGDTIEAAAERVGRSESTGDRWASAWNRGGPDALVPKEGGGRPPKLDDSQRDALRERLAGGEPWQSTAIQQLLDEEFDVSFHPNYLPTFLQELGMCYVPASAEQRRKEPVSGDDAGTETGGWLFE